MVSNAHAPIWPEAPAPQHITASYAEAEPHSYWFDTVTRDHPVWRGAAPAAVRPTETPPIETDLAVVGGGLTGLWAALEAKEREPERDVLLLEGERIGFGASGRNGGFISSSLTHGLANGLSRFPDDMQTLERLGLENLTAIQAAVRRYGIECELELDGSLSVALTDAEVAELPAEVDELHRFGHSAELLDAAGIRALVDSPTFKGAVWQSTGEGLVNPVKLCLGLHDTVTGLGVRVIEGAAVEKLERRGDSVQLKLSGGQALRARRVLLATAAFRGLVPALRRRIVPVYDYVLVSEPLSPEQHAAVGWQRKIGISDRGNRFHYYRPTADGRILWGGYDAVYSFGGGVGPSHDQRENTFARLAQHFFHTFPQLEGLRFSHRWGGAIDTCSRFSAFYGTAHSGRVAYAAGHTGLGVGAARFAARIALDLLEGERNDLTELDLVRQKPLPFPPEPLRWGVIELTRNRLAAADRQAGERGLWLRTLDRLGLGFDS